MSRLITQCDNKMNRDINTALLTSSQIFLTKEEKDELDLYILNLKIISNIKEYDKLSIYEQKLEIDCPSMFQGVWRNWNRQGRKESLDFLKQLIDKIFDFTDKLLIMNQRGQMAKAITIGNTSGVFYKNIVNNSELGTNNTEVNNTYENNCHQVNENQNNTIHNNNYNQVENNQNEHNQENNIVGFNEPNSCVFSTIMIHLDEAIKGIQNLKITYLGDTSINSELDMIIGKMYNRIEKIKKILVVRLK